MITNESQALAPVYVRTRLKSRANFAVCKGCGEIVTARLYWRIGTSEWLHRSGAKNHDATKFAYFTFIRPGGAA